MKGRGGGGYSPYLNVSQHYLSTSICTCATSYRLISRSTLKYDLETDYLVMHQCLNYISKLKSYYGEIH
jgi:hypothetical protein